MRNAAIVGLVAAVLAGCNAAGGNPRRPLQVPNTVSGGTRGGGRPASPTLERQKEDEVAAAETRASKLAAERQKQEQKAETLWTSAQALERKDAEDAADAYQQLCQDHPTHPRSDEAGYREAVLRFQTGDWNGTERALEQYMRVAPVNAHLPEVERMMYESSVKILQSARGFSGVFRSKKRGFDGLNFVADNFPAGRYPDDALLAIGDEYVLERDYEAAALQYQELLVRFPDSEWSFAARLKLGDALLARDQGANYHAGYVDLDPRGRTDDAYKQGRPVRSCVAAALEQYEAFLERVSVDPARRSEYAREVGYAQGKVAECRKRLADKDRRTAAYYGGAAGAIYEESARGIESGVALGRSGINGGAVPVLTVPGTTRRAPAPVVAAPPPRVAPPPPPPPPPPTLPTPKPTLPPPPPPTQPLEPAEEPTAPRPPPPTPESNPAMPVFESAQQIPPPLPPHAPTEPPPPRRVPIGDATR